uniref:Glutamate N-acetyltransferase n=1 Tax=Lactuca sativa TaxID=4236 RepID=A0A9R1W4D0_LACSA|nr:hypothetical protein LSAT_V11C300109310 [Lactuca sativa]
MIIEILKMRECSRAAASNYLKEAGDAHGTVKIQISIGDGPGTGLAWGCDLSYDYVKINYATSLGSGSLDKCWSSKCSHVYFRHFFSLVLSR